MDAKEIVRKVKETPVPKVKKVALAYSGGLDSSLCVELLRRKYKAEEIVPITVDVGQGKEEIEEGRKKAEVLGVKQTFIDARDEFCNEWLARAIRASADYNGYPVSTSMTRQLIAKIVALEGAKRGCDALMEGSTGKGNDQYRMHNVFTLFAPECAILAPVRDLDLTRDQEKALCLEWGVPVTEQIEGGDDKTMWCRSIASGAIGLDQELPESIWMWYRPPEKAREEGEVLEIEFAQGLPVSVDRKEMRLDDLVAELNVRAGRNGIGFIDMFEDGIMDLKSREIYEAPAAHVILKLHRDLEQQCLLKDELQFKKVVEHRWAYMVYHGEWFHPLKGELDAFIEASQETVSGRFKVKLYRGNITILERRSEMSLFSPEIRSIKARGFDQRWSAKAAKIRGLPYEILAARRRKLGADR